MKVLLKNQNDSTICLIFQDGYWFLPEIHNENEKQAEAELKQVTGVAEIKIIEKQHNLLHAICTNDTQENLDILIGWFHEEDALRSIEEKEKKLLQEALTQSS